MAQNRLEHGEKRRGVIRVLAILCACLMMFAATAQVAHSHSAVQGPDHCQICIAIHSPLPASPAVTQLLLQFTGNPVSPAPPAIPRLEGTALLSDRAPPVLA
jgi:hypothetical protein